MSPRFSRQEKAKWVASPNRDSQRPSRRPPVRIHECDNGELIEKNKLTLVGRVTNAKIQHPKALVHYMLQFWNLEGRVTGRDLGPEKFQFTFKTEHDLQLVLSWSPFHFKHWMFILQRWEPVVLDAFPAKILFWIQLQGVPQHYWTDKALKSIGEDVGTVEAVDTEQVRVRVNINALLPLEKQIPILLPTGETTMVDLEYEKLEKHCFQCFSLTHEKKDCPTRYDNSRKGSQESDINKNNTLLRLENNKRRQSSSKPASRDYVRQKEDYPRRYETRSPVKSSSRRENLHPHSHRKESTRSVFAGRLRDHPSEYKNRASARISPSRNLRCPTFQNSREQFPPKRSQHSEWRSRTSPIASRSFQATHDSQKGSVNSTQRSSASQR